MTMAKRKIVSLILALAMLISLISVMAVSSFAATSGITAFGGWFETAYVEWSPISGAEGYNVYVAAAGSSDWKPLDDMLIRNYGSYWRADAVGLKAGSYQMKVVPVVNKAEVDGALISSSITVIAHDRSGFAFVNGTSSGAYNENGTLKSNARVLYVTNENKDSIVMNVAISKSGPEPIVGLQNILTALKKGYEKDPVCIRFIGNITDPANLDKGDLLIDCGEGKFTGGITLEGIGEDTVFNGFGLRIKGATNVEVRNIAFMNCNSNEGDNVGLQQDNDHIWIHNCDFFYGDAGSDADQAKGDGALDTKKSTYVTHSYNHFWDCGKVHLNGNGDTTLNYITYHHNWYDHCDSRMPRVRVSSSVHVYNNFFDGISKYGIGATTGCSIFSESNYYLNTSRPMMISMQGTDIAGDGEGTFSSEAGGIIKSYGDVMVFTNKSLKLNFVPYSQDNQHFDAYVAASRNETVPGEVKTLKGGTGYSNFDTASGFYSYDVQSAEDAMNTVKNLAGRLGDDFTWEWTDADDTNYDVNSRLKSVLTNYKSSIVSIGGNGTNASTGNDPGSDNGGSDNGGNEGGSIGGNEGGITDNEGGNAGDGGDNNPGAGQGGSIIPTGAYIHNFTESGKDSQFFKISGNLSSSKGDVTYNGLTLTQCLKIESSTNISFTAPEKGTLILVFGGNTNASGKTVVIDGTKSTIDSTEILTLEIEAGDHTITKGDSINLFYMAYVSDSYVEHTHSYTEEKTEPTCTEKGKITYICQCGDSYIEETEAIGHSFGDGVCAICGASDPDYVPPHTHSFVEGKCECGEIDPTYTPENPGEQKPGEGTGGEENKPNDEAPEGGENKGDSDGTDETPTEPEQPKKDNFITRIFKAIISFLKKLFGFFK